MCLNCVQAQGPSGEAPYVALGCVDGCIRLLSMGAWKVTRRLHGGHKGAVTALMLMGAHHDPRGRDNGLQWGEKPSKSHLHCYFGHVLL